MTTLLSTSKSFLTTLMKHLWLSISSVKFYEGVFKNYKGYGIKYALNLALFSSLMCTILFLFQLDKIRSYLNNDTTSNNLEEIDHIFRQLPEINYNGVKISTTEEVPFFLRDLRNNKIIALDPDDKLMPADKSRLSMVLTSQNLIINILDSDGILRTNMPIKYEQIFGNNPQILTQEFIKSKFAEIFDKSPSLFIYLVFPLFAFLLLINLLFDKALLIVIIYFITRILTANASIKQSIRMVFFASGITILLQFIIALTIPAFSAILWGVQIWANILMILGILKHFGKYQFIIR